MKSFRPLLSLLFVCAATLLGCGGGGGGSDLGVGACSALDVKVFNGDTCDQNARSPVVAIRTVVNDGTQTSEVGMCTGTLVTVDDILTSAHCFTDPILSGLPVQGFVAYVGGERIVMANHQIHPRYSFRAGSRYDVAMATLQRVPNPAIGPVPILVSQYSLPGQKASTFGYGTNNLGEIGILKSAEFSIDDIINGNIYASLETSGASICPGDSGGPLIQVVEGVSTLIGVNSFVDRESAEKCATIGAQFSGFVDVQHVPTLEFIFSYAPDIPVQ